jgi:hypothetical protein
MLFLIGSIPQETDIYFSSLNKFNFFTQFVFFSNKNRSKTTKQMRILETIETVIENRQFASTQIRFFEYCLTNS